MSRSVTVVDYGLGNIHSLTKVLEHLNADISYAENSSQIDRASRIILPGVGSFPSGVKGLIERGQFEVLRDFSKSERPLLGICLGCQLLFSESNEYGRTKGLNILPGYVRKIPVENNPIPHIGWNRLNIIKNSFDRLCHYTSLKEGTWAYFAHSYHCIPEDKKAILATCDYSNTKLTAIVGNGNVFGFQFHPEKSSREGIRMLDDFLNLG